MSDTQEPTKIELVTALLRQAKEKMACGLIQDAASLVDEALRVLDLEENW